MSDRMRAHPDFIKKLKSDAALCGMSINKYTKVLAEQGRVDSLPLNKTYSEYFGGKNEKKNFKFNL